MSSYILYPETDSIHVVVECQEYVLCWTPVLGRWFFGALNKHNSMTIGAMEPWRHGILAVYNAFEIQLLVLWLVDYWLSYLVVWIFGGLASQPGSVHPPRTYLVRNHLAPSRRRHVIQLIKQPLTWKKITSFRELKCILYSCCTTTAPNGRLMPHCSNWTHVFEL